MAISYRDAPEIADLARELIDRYPQHFMHLNRHQVRYRWRSNAQTKNGKVVLGTARLVGGSEAVEATGGAPQDCWVLPSDRAHFRIEIAHDVWQDLSTHQREALVFHELLHCGEDDDEKPMIMPHDLEEFRAAVEEFGLWKSDLQAFAQSLSRVGQLRLVDLDDEENAA